MDAVFCNRCNLKQSHGWQPGHLCEHCGDDVREETRCGWCCSWTIKGRFCRDCGFELLDSSVFGAARMLKGAGIDQLQLPERLQALDDGKIQHYNSLYNQQYSVVVRRVEELRYVQQHLAISGYDDELENELIKLLPLPADKIEEWSAGGDASNEAKTLDRLLQIMNQSPFENTRALALISLIGASNPEFAQDHSDAVVNKVINLLGQNTRFTIEVINAFSHWKTWSPEFGLRIFSEEIASALLEHAEKLKHSLNKQENTSFNLIIATIILRCNDTLDIDKDLYHWSKKEVQLGLTSKNTLERLTSALTVMDESTLTSIIDFQPSWHSMTVLRELAFNQSENLIPFIENGNEHQLYAIYYNLARTNKALPEPIQSALLPHIQRRDEEQSLGIIGCLCVGQGISDDNYNTILKYSVRDQQPKYITDLIAHLPQVNHNAALDALSEHFWEAQFFDETWELIGEQARKYCFSTELVTKLIGQMKIWHDQNDLISRAEYCNQLLQQQILLDQRNPELSDFSKNIPTLIEFSLAWLEDSQLVDKTTEWVIRLFAGYESSIPAYLSSNPNQCKIFVDLFLTQFQANEFSHDDRQAIVKLFNTKNSNDLSIIEEHYHTFEFNQNFLLWLYSFSEITTLNDYILIDILKFELKNNHLDQHQVRNLLSSQQKLNSKHLISAIRLLVNWSLDTQSDLSKATHSHELIRSLFNYKADLLNAHEEIFSVSSIEGWSQHLFSSQEECWTSVIQCFNSPEPLPMEKWLVDNLFNKNFTLDQITHQWQQPMVDALLNLFIQRTNQDYRRSLGYTLASLVSPDTQHQHWLDILLSQTEENAAYEPLLEKLIYSWSAEALMTCFNYCITKLADNEFTEQLNDDIQYLLVVNNDHFKNQVPTLEENNLIDIIECFVQYTNENSPRESHWYKGKKIFDLVLNTLFKRDKNKAGEFVFKLLLNKNLSDNYSPYYTVVNLLQDQLSDLIDLSNEHSDLHSSTETFLLSSLHQAIGEDGHQLVSKQHNTRLICDLLRAIEEDDFSLSSEASDQLTLLIEQLDDDENELYFQYRHALESAMKRILRQENAGEEEVTHEEEDPEISIAKQVVFESIESFEQQLESILASLDHLPEASKIATLIQLKMGFQSTFDMIKPHIEKLTTELQEDANNRINTILEAVSH